MDSQDSVVHVDGQTTWTDALFASFRPRDRHVSDEEIVEILNAGSDGEAAAELLAAKGITVPMYCLWKAKYRHLNLQELREARRREIWFARGVLVLLLAAAVSGAGGIAFALGRAAQSNITRAAGPTAADVPSIPMKPESFGSGTVRATSSPRPATSESAPAVRHERGVGRQATAAGRAPEASVAEDASRSDANPPTSETVYKIQVAAAPSLQEGRAILERLASAGYPAYLSRAIVSNVEMYRVRVGPFETLPAAEGVASRLQRDGYNGAWITR